MLNASFDPGSLTRRLRIVICLVVITCSTPLLAQAIPLREYHANLKLAISALAPLVGTDEPQEPNEFQLREATALIRNALPEKQSVESDKEIITVDNSWLNDELSDLEKSSAADRIAKLKRILGRLEALEERVSEIEKSGTLGPDNSNAKARLESILARPEYSTVRSECVDPSNLPLRLSVSAGSVTAPGIGLLINLGEWLYSLGHLP